jgi:hypothetical protein
MVEAASASTNFPPDKHLRSNPLFRRIAMKSTLMIKDLSVAKELDRSAMSAVRGGIGNQANSTGQSNSLAMFAPVSVGNGSAVSGPVTFQVDSNPTQTASNDNTSSNFSGLWLAPIYALV